MLEYVKDAITTVQQPPLSPLDDEALRWTLGGLCALFFALFAGMAGYVWSGREKVSDQIADAVETAKKEMAGSIFANADRIAREVRDFDAAKDELWRKIDEFMRYRVDDARNLVTKADLEASRQDARKDRRDTEDRLMHSISELRAILTDLIARKQ